MGIRDVFKSKKERDKEESRQKKRGVRQKNREIAKQLQGLDTKIDEIRSKRDDDWAKAKEYLANGQKAKAQDSLRSYRVKEVMASKLEGKRDFYESRVLTLQTGHVDIEMAKELKGLSSLLNIDVDTLEEDLDEVNATFDDISEIDSIMDMEQKKHMSESDRVQSESLPALDDMFNELQGEVAAEISADSLGDQMTSPELKGDKSEKIGKLRERLEGLMED